MKFSRLFFALALVLVVGCSSNKQSSNEQSPSAPNYSGGSGIAYDNQSKDETGSTDYALNNGEQKVITTIGLELETKNYTQTIADVEALTASLGGYVQSSNIPRNPDGEKYTGLYAQFVVLIPTEKIDGFITSTSSFSNIRQEYRNAQNVTDQYTDATTRLSNLRVKEERLLELLKKSGTLADLLQIESELSNTRYEIELYETQLKNYDTRIAYTQISVNIQEVYTYTPKDETTSLWERIEEEFANNYKVLKNGLANFLVFAMSGLPFLLLQIVLVIVPLYLLYWILKKLGVFRYFTKQLHHEAAIPSNQTLFDEQKQTDDGSKE